MYLLLFFGDGPARTTPANGCSKHPARADFGVNVDFQVCFYGEFIVDTPTNINSKNDFFHLLNTETRSNVCKSLGLTKWICWWLL
jgi:hypothetical protein